MPPVNTTLAGALLIFGATGDLAQRMLLPSLYALHEEGLIAPDFRIFGTARRPLSDGDFRTLAGQALQKHLPHDQYRSDVLAPFLKRLHYIPLDTSDPATFGALTQTFEARSARLLAIFLSTAPSLFEPTIAGLQAAGIDGKDARIALEKPLGHDLASSRLINDAVARAFPEDRIFRIDHYLGKETVQNLLALRFGNTLFEPLWNAGSIDHVQITVSETVGLEGRIGFYDDAGALRDMVQNHMLQLLGLVAMEAPAHLNAAAVRDEKVKVLRALRPIDESTVADHSVIGQYGPGTADGAALPSYADELGAPSGTETFVALKAHIDNWRWKGVPFYLRTGKRLPQRRTEILIQFKDVPHSVFAERGGQLRANKLLIRLQPEENVRLLVMTKVPGLDRDGVHLREVSLDLSLTDAFASTRRRIAYERLLLDLIEGDTTLFVRRDEVEGQWEWIDRIREGWVAAGMRPRPYPAGSWGPAAANDLVTRDGVLWHD